MATSFPGLEVEVLKGVDGAPVEVGGGLAVADGSGEVTLCGPDGGAMAGRGEALEARVRRRESDGRVVEAPLRGESAAEDELRVADLVEEVVAPREEVE